MFNDFSFKSWEEKRLLNSCKMSDQMLASWRQSADHTSAFEVFPYGRKTFWCLSWESRRLKQSNDDSMLSIPRKRRIFIREALPERRTGRTAHQAATCVLDQAKRERSRQMISGKLSLQRLAPSSERLSEGHVRNQDTRSVDRPSPLQAPGSTFQSRSGPKWFPAVPPPPHIHSDHRQIIFGSLPTRPQARFKHKGAGWRTGMDIFRDPWCTQQQPPQGPRKANSLARQTLAELRVFLGPQSAQGIARRPLDDSPGHSAAYSSSPLLGQDPLHLGQDHQPTRSQEQSAEQVLAMEQGSAEWFALRESRLTASSFCKALGFFGKGRIELWEEKTGIRGGFAGNVATQWGQNMEATALGHYQIISGNEVESFPFQIYGSNTGDESRGWLGASPDGLLRTDLLGGKSSPGVLEIKCPFNKGSPHQARPHHYIPYYYVPQIQGLLEILDRDWLDFYSWTVGGSTIFRVERDQRLWQAMFSSMEELWFENVVPARDIVRGIVLTEGPVNSASAQGGTDGIVKALEEHPELRARVLRAVEAHRPTEQHILSDALKKACQQIALKGRILRQSGPVRAFHSLSNS